MCCSSALACIEVIMSEDLLRQVAAVLNKTPGAAERAPRMAALVAENNTRAATEAVTNMPFDSSPYAYQAWLAAVDKN
jgi:hypothetical protein